LCARPRHFAVDLALVSSTVTLISVAVTPVGSRISLAGLGVS
jgi:hypothetical protein